MLNKKIILLSTLLIASTLLSSCNQKSTPATFDSDTSEPETISPYIDQLAQEKINLTQSYNLNQEFKVSFKTTNPDGLGTATFKARSIKEISKAGNNLPEDNKILVLVEISVKGDRNNKGQPSGFNQIGDTPSPQFVLIDKTKNISYAEETYFSDSYTQSKNLFELSKITLDQDQWVHTALVFQIDKSLAPDLALRFTNSQGQTEFYDIKENVK